MIVATSPADGGTDVEFLASSTVPQPPPATASSSSSLSSPSALCLASRNSAASSAVASQPWAFRNSASLFSFAAAANAAFSSSFATTS